MLLVACRPEEQKTESIGAEEFQEARALPAAVRAQLDSGNAAIRARQFEQASRHFTEATRGDAKSKPAWFGLYLAERALGNAAAANAALERAQKLAPGATLLRPDPQDTTR
jgi:Flp pilus assembly protein TadD